VQLLQNRTIGPRPFGATNAVAAQVELQARNRLRIK
jgi:hypothetical protein